MSSITAQSLAAPSAERVITRCITRQMSVHGANIRVVNTEERLFAVGDLGMALAAQQDKARQAIDKWDPSWLNLVRTLAGPSWAILAPAINPDERSGLTATA